MIHVTPINDEDWREQGYLSAASATCERAGCGGFQLIGIFRKDAWAVTLEYGELSLQRKLQDNFGWKGGSCPNHNTEGSEDEAPDEVARGEADQDNDE